MVEATFHCGGGRIQVPAEAGDRTGCNCTIDRRLGALWAYYKVGTVRIVAQPESLSEYIWGEKTIRTVRCRHCGCVTHWEPLEPKADSKLGVNARNFEPSVLARLRVRR